MTHPLPPPRLEDSPRGVAGLELRYEPLPGPEEVQGWLRVAYEAGLAAGLETTEETA